MASHSFSHDLPLPSALADSRTLLRGVRTERLHGSAETRPASEEYCFDEMIAAIGAGLESEAVLRLVASTACALVGCGRCSVYLRQTETGLYRGQVIEPSEADDDERIKRLVCGTDADGFTREILATKLPVLIRNAQHDGRAIRSAMRAWNVRSMLGVPMIVGQDVTGILFLDDEGAAHPFHPEQQALARSFAHLAAIAIVQAQHSTEMRANVASFARQNEILRQSSTVEERLTTLALEGATLGAIAAAVSDVTGKPCAIHDADYRRLAVCGPGGRDAPIPHILDVDYRELPEVAEALAALKPNRPAIVGPLPAGGVLHRFLVTRIVLSGKAWGYLTQMEFGGRFTALDMAASRHSATAIAVQFSVERRAAVADRHARQALVRDLVNGLEDQACLVRRAELMGFRIASPHVVSLLSTENGQGALDPEEVEAAWSSIGQPEPMWATTVPHGAIAIAVEMDDDSPRTAALAQIKDAIERLRLQFEPQRHVLAALSTPCRTPADYSRGYEEAIRVLDCLKSLRGERLDALALLAADDLGAARLLLKPVDEAEADRFIRNSLGPLLHAESAAADGLLSTVRVFFERGKSVRRSAKRLGVHENTIRYRLGRVSALTGLDVATDADAQLTIQVALLMLQIQGRLPELSAEAGRSDTTELSREEGGDTADGVGVHLP
jgi:sugar diacid utilization regulator